MILTLVIVALVLAALAVVLHLLPKQADPTIAKAQHDVDAVYDWIVTHLEHHAAPAVTVPVVGGSTNQRAPINPAVPVTPQEYVDACLRASAGTGGFRNGVSWNAAEYLRQMDVKTFANWCAALAALPECSSGGPIGASAGWLTNLSQQGQGIILTLTSQGLTLPATDPR